MTWANRITILRILLVPVFVALLFLYELKPEASGLLDPHWRIAALAVFVVAGLSDALDGFLARYCNQKSDLGALLDPVADKLLVLAALSMLSFLKIRGVLEFPVAFAALVIGRDAFLLSGYLFLRSRMDKVEIKPHWSGKGATFFVLLAIALALLEHRWMLPACRAGAVLVGLSTLCYTRDGLRIWRQRSRVVA